MHAWSSWRSEEGVRSSPRGVTVYCEPPCWCWQLNFGFQQEQQMLLHTELSLQHKLIKLEFSVNSCYGLGIHCPPKWFIYSKLKFLTQAENRGNVQHASWGFCLQTDFSMDGFKKWTDHWEVVELCKLEPGWRKKVMNECVGGYSLSWLLLLVPFSASFLSIPRDSSASRCPRHHVALPPRKPTVMELGALRFIPMKWQALELPPQVFVTGVC